jgi:pimeloyl-ACP methyl ester carboxylesterase
MPSPRSKSNKPAKKAAKPSIKSDDSPKDEDAKKGETILSFKELLEKYDSDGNLPGEHKVEGGDFTGDVARRGRFRRRSSPSMRAQTAATPEDCSLVQLVEKNGILSWQIAGEETFSPTPGFRAGPRRALVRTPGEVVRSFEFEKIPGSQTTAALIALDKKLTPDADYGLDHNRNGLMRWDVATEAFIPCGLDCKLAGEKVLLIIHGTFSNSKAFLNPTFKGLLNDAATKSKDGYGFVLAFDHPTLSVSPMLNAFDLAARLRDRGDPKQLDIICHSRGGLVTRWYCEAFAPVSIKRRAILVACPLGGTSLAAPHRIREVFNLLTNVSRVGSVAAGFFGGPFFLAAKGIMALTASVTGALTGPLTDAVVSLIPGLDGQSRTGNNQELRRLHLNTGTAPFSDPKGDVRYWSILSNFEPDTSGAWGFLRSFSRPLQTLANRGADFVFEGPNDLVVDTASMTEASRGRNVIEVLHDFGTNHEVHHTNYFDHKTTLLKIREAFEI